MNPLSGGCLRAKTRHQPLDFLLLGQEDWKGFFKAGLRLALAGVRDRQLSKLSVARPVAESGT
jgi:hypothetical protein